MANFLRKRTQFAELYGSKSALRETSLGVPQVTVWAPPTFNSSTIYFGNFEYMSTDAKVVKSADVSFSCFRGVISRPNGAELIILEMVNWFDLHGFILNSSKSSEMIILLTALAGLATRDEVCGLPCTRSTKILGMHVQYNLKYDTHIAKCTATRLKHLGFNPKSSK